MLPVPEEKRELIDFANRTVEECRISAGARAAQGRLMNAIAETGRYDGQKALINMMNSHLERSAAHIYSPVELKFDIDFEAKYPKREMDRAAVVANVLTRQWDRTNTDILFGRGVYEALKYGACIMKQWVQAEGSEGQEHNVQYQKLVLPWQFGVYNEAENDINKQSALCETTLMTLPEVWRRIWHLPGAKKLFERIKSHAQSGSSMSETQDYFHQLLSTSQLNTGMSGATTPMPGGIVQLGNDPNYSLMGPVVSAPVVQCHEIWVQDERDYTTIIFIEPDIIVAPIFNKANLLIKDSGLQPYRLIQPNEVTNWFWGRSELTDLIEPQGLLAVYCDDSKRLMGLQIDKILGFTGENGMTDELYGQFRQAGWANLGQGGKIEDVTPKFPSELLPMIKFMIEEVNSLGSFPPIMQGQGEPGVRAGNHASTLLKTASPTLRDRSLLVERQCAVHADLTLQIMEAKDPRKYWTNGDTVKAIEETQFLLTDLPDDWRVTIDSHSSSPIFANEIEQEMWAAFKAGVVDEQYMLDNRPFPNKEAAKLAARERKAAKQAEFQKLLEQFPEVGEKIALKTVAGGRK
jgi:hypothetical protein